MTIGKEELQITKTTKQNDKGDVKSTLYWEMTSRHFPWEATTFIVINEICMNV
jgi:hypothetical protein